jgi:hypothetical protein
LSDIIYDSMVKKTHGRIDVCADSSADCRTDMREEVRVADVKIIYDNAKLSVQRIAVETCI